MKRVILVVTLTLLSSAVCAQETTAATTAPTATTATTSTATATTAASPAVTREPESRAAVRERFLLLLERHPRELGRVLAYDPTLVSNEAFVGRYPEVAEFLNAHPEVRRNPHYYVPDAPREPQRQGSSTEAVAEMLTIMFVCGLTLYSLGWLLRTIIEQKRWNQLSRRQAEVHAKVLDRFGSSEELLAYVRSPAGSKFLESAPIPLQPEPVKPNSQASRVMWSMQIGLVLAAAGLGMLLVSLRFSGEAAHGFFAMGVIAFCTGGGFIASALVSLGFSRRWTSEGDENPAKTLGEGA